MTQETTLLMTLLQQAGMNPQVCDTPVAYDHRSVRCGTPSAPGDAEAPDYCLLPSRMMGSTLEFVLDVIGDSMRDAGFESGDRIRVRTGVSVRDGDIVVASIDGEYTVKVLFTDDQNRHWLIPRNDDYAPILLTSEMEVNIVGRVVELIKPTPSLSCSECMKAIRRTHSSITIPPSRATVEAAIRRIAPRVMLGRQWYAVYRALLDRAAVDEDDYAGFTALVMRLVPGHACPPAADELRRMAVQSFRRQVGLWNRNDAPVSGKRFDDYQRIARLMLDLLS